MKSTSSKRILSLLLCMALILAPMTSVTAFATEPEKQLTELEAARKVFFNDETARLRTPSLRVIEIDGERTKDVRDVVPDFDDMNVLQNATLGMSVATAGTTGQFDASLFGAPNKLMGAQGPFDVGDVKQFGVAYLKASATAQVVTATLVGQSNRTNVWVLDDEEYHEATNTEHSPTCHLLDVNEAVANEIATTFDASFNAMTDPTNGFTTYGKIEKNPAENAGLSNIGDADGDGKVNFLLYDLFGYNNGAVGFFMPADFMSNIPVEWNQIDMMHIDIGDGLGWDSVRPGATEEDKADLYNTLAHEFQHLLFFSTFGWQDFVYELEHDDSTYGSTSWINEALAATAGAYYGVPGAYIKRALAAGGAGSGVYEDGGDYLNWNGELKNYDIAAMWSALMRKTFPNFQKKMYDYMKTSLNGTVTKANNDVGNMLKAATNIGSGGENTLKLVTQLAFEAIYTDGGSIIINDVPTDIPLVYSDGYYYDNTWCWRNVIGVDGGIIPDANSSSFTQYLTPTKAKADLKPSGSTISYTRLASPYTGNLQYRLTAPTGNQYLKITMPQGNDPGAQYYIGTANDEIITDGEYKYSTGLNGGKVYALDKGTEYYIPTGGKQPMLFVTAFLQDINRVLTYEYVDTLPGDANVPGGTPIVEPDYKDIVVTSEAQFDAALADPADAVRILVDGDILFTDVKSIPEFKTIRIDGGTAGRLLVGKNIRHLNVTGGTLFLGEGLTIARSAAYSNTGGGLLLTSGNVYLDGATITNVTAAVKVDGGTFTLLKGSVTGNQGIGISANGISNVHIKGGEISSNTSNGILMDGTASLFMVNGMIKKNTATNGGGISHKSNGIVELKGGVISENVAVEKGGGVYVYANNNIITFSGTEITGNEAEDGGGVYLDIAGTANLNSGNIHGNSATAGGGGVYNASNDINVRGINIYDNTAKSGGGLYSNGGIVDITAINLQNNTAAERGGGAYINPIEYGTGAKVTISGATVKDNSAPMGGGMYIASTALHGVKVDNSSFINNTATNDGGAIYYAELKGSITKNSVSDSVKFSNNAAQKYWVYDPVLGDPQYPDIKAATVSIGDHPLNNYDIKWVRESFDVHFVVDGAEVLKETVDWARLATKPTDPVKEGETFSGWYTTADGGSKWNFATSKVKEETYLYARFNVTGEPDPEPGVTNHTITFNSNGGTSVLAKSVAPGGKLVRPVDPTRAGYTFQGWFTTPALSVAYDFNAVVNNSFTLYAKWSKNSTPNTNSSSGSKSTSTSTRNYMSAEERAAQLKARNDEEIATLGRVTNSMSAIGMQQMFEALSKEEKAKETWTLKLKNVTEIYKQFWPQIRKELGENKALLMFDSTQPNSPNSIDVRLYIDPSKVKTTLNPYASHQSATAKKTQQKFKKFFANNIDVVHFEQKEFDVPVHVAVNLKMEPDTSGLYFYSYDAETNKYRKLSPSKVWVDKNNYLHFMVKTANSVVISQGPLESVNEPE